MGDSVYVKNSPGINVNETHCISRKKASKKEGRENIIFGGLLFILYGLISRDSIRRLIRYLVLKMEGQGFYSVTIRKILSKYHGVNVGMYTQGPCYSAENFLPGTTIGRYCSIYPTVMQFSGNHPMNTKSTHSFFYNPTLGYAKNDIISRSRLTIGNDVWCGHNAIILPGVTSIGDGAVIGAGSVVNQNVPAYAVVVGNPARVVRYRFSESTIKELRDSRWWEKSIEDLLPEIEGFRKPLEGDGKIR